MTHFFKSTYFLKYDLSQIVSFWNALQVYTGCHSFILYRHHYIFWHNPSFLTFPNHILALFYTSVQVDFRKTRDRNSNFDAMREKTSLGWIPGIDVTLLCEGFFGSIQWFPRRTTPIRWLSKYVEIGKIFEKFCHKVPGGCPPTVLPT